MSCCQRVISLLENMHNLNHISLNLQRVDLYDEHALSSNTLSTSANPVPMLLLLPLKTADEAGAAGWEGGVRGGGVRLSLITLRGDGGKYKGWITVIVAEQQQRLSLSGGVMGR